MENKKLLLIITTILLSSAEILSAQSSGMGTLPFDATAKMPDYSNLTADMTYVVGMINNLFFIETFDGPVLPETPAVGYVLDPPITISVPLASAGTTYSLYTYKSSFYQDNKRNVLQGIQECWTTTPITTQQDIDNYLDKIYEFGADKTYTSNDGTMSLFDWDGYTDPKVTDAQTTLPAGIEKGKRYPVRDCVYVAAHDANGKLIGVLCGTCSLASSSVVERNWGAIAINTTAGAKTVSADIYYVRARPVKNFSAILVYSDCVLANVPYADVNKGTEQIVADMNSMDGSVIAYKEFGPIVADGQAHALHWNDITKINWSDPKWKALLPAGNFPGLGGLPYYRDIPGLDGKAFVPDPSDPRYALIYITETDDMTYTGIIDGSINYNFQIPFPSPSNSSALPVVNEDQSQFKVTMTPDGYKVECEGAACVKETQVTDILGRVLAKKVLPTETKAAQVAVALQPGQIYVVSNIGEDGKQVSVKVVAGRW